jgi:hypothetical protein
MTQKGISTTSPQGEFLAAPLLTFDDAGSFDLKAIRERMAFRAQDEKNR